MKAEELATRLYTAAGFARSRRWEGHADTLKKIADDIETALTLAQQEARAAALEEAARMAETWGNAPPNPHGRRAALAAGIRALLEGK